MKIQVGRLTLLLLSVVLLSSLLVFASGATTLLPDSEVAALKEISQALQKSWDFSVDPCSGKSGWVTPKTRDDVENNVTCDCSHVGCHVISITLTRQSLPGILPPALAKLPYLQVINLLRNYLNGSIPKEWGSLQLVDLILSGNRLSGFVPVEIANITTLKNLALEFNRLSGVLPQELGNLVNVERLLISSNNFVGPLPETLAKLTNMKDFWISDNNFSGKIPNFIQNWTNLQTAMLLATGLEGPIPSGMFLLTKITDLRITDLNGPEAPFPPLSNMNSIVTLMLRSCNIIGEVPAYLANMTNLQTLDLSFNKLVGQFRNSIGQIFADYIYLTGNALTGPVPDWKDKANVDLSYNNVTLESSGSPICQLYNINAFGTASLGKNSTGVAPCLKNVMCPQKRYSFHINCGGDEIIVNGSVIYEADRDSGGASEFFLSKYWAFSSTGKFIDNQHNVGYIATNTSRLTMKDNQLYMTARLSPLSLTYYGFCLVNGIYTVTLHFAEIMFTNDKTYKSLGRRFFDIYIQGKLVLKDFNIEEEAGGVDKAVIKKFTAVVTGTTLDIRFYWAGKGTVAVPSRGVYGPLISAISVDSNFKPPLDDKNKTSLVVKLVVILSVSSLLVMIIGFLWWKRCFWQRNTHGQGLMDSDLNTGSFTLKQIIAATNNFDVKNKIGEGGFGAVYKGHLSDGTAVAVKQLSSRSRQGNREFVNEIGLISSLQHPNLVKLYGCCTEGNELLLVYEFMENNSLARVLLGPEDCRLQLDWPTRQKICVGIAKALAFLHEESRLKIVHRDIKASNVLLDKDLNAKVSDFGLAKLYEDDNSHVSTRIAGTLGYMAPEYAMRGHLTYKADVYSFGVVALEIVSGRSNSDYIATGECEYLLDWALALQEKGDLMELVDPKLELNSNKEEVKRMIDVALQCANVLPKRRPTMSSVVSILEGQITLEEIMSELNISSDDIKFKSQRSHFSLGQDQSGTSGQSLNLSVDGSSLTDSSATTFESQVLNNKFSV